MRDYERDEETTTIVRYSLTLPANWTDVQKLLAIVLQDTDVVKMTGSNREPYDDQLWYESDGEVLSLCFKKQDD